MEEDANDSSTWDLDLIRKHELAETTDHDIVYRQHDGRIVNWTEGATQRAADLLQKVEDVRSDMERLIGLAEDDWGDIKQVLSHADEILESVEDALQRADLAKEWAIKENGKVREDNIPIDYSSKYYASKSNESALNAKESEVASNNARVVAQEAINLIHSHETELELMSHFKIIDGCLYQVMED